MPAPADSSKSYLSETLTAFSPWGSRASTPRPQKSEEALRESTSAAAVTTTSGAKRGGDHRISNKNRLSLSSYPSDCPRLDVQWFHAIDIPKRKPNYVHTVADDKAPVKPKKWNAFSTKDSKAIEAAFKRQSDDDERVQLARDEAEKGEDDAGATSKSKGRDRNANRSFEAGKQKSSPAVKVAVNEDFLFDVDVSARELGPAYWVGPIYEIRRGTWFDGSSLAPCDENLATQLEEGYLKTQPWRQSPIYLQRPEQSRSVSGTADAPIDLTQSTKDGNKDGPSEEQPQPVDSQTSKSAKAPPALLTHRLFGSYMNHTATYQDTTTAWILSDDFMSKVSSAMLQRFVGGSGTKYIRGYSEVLKKRKPAKDANKRPVTPTKSEQSTSEKRQSLSGVKSATADVPPEMPDGTSAEDTEPESRVQSLERQMSSLVSSAMPEDPDKQDEEARKREEKEIQDDYRDTSGEAQDREIEHLILVTHGIGQRLGARFESFNFIHDVNDLRKTLKMVYGHSADLQALNGEVDEAQKNCRVQVLPVMWRHLLGFPQQGVKHNKRENDITDSAMDDEEEYPTLDSITVEGVPALRNIVADLALDVLLYQTPAYKDHISRIVVKECNRIFKLFKKRNPSFNGKVSLVGHSLGSAVMFDVLASQHKDEPTLERGQHKTSSSPEQRLDFDVEDFFCFGSPIGLFQMLNGRTIGGRGNPNKVTLDGYPDSLDDPFQDSTYARLPANMLSDSQRDAMTSSPKCRQLYNIFHPTDPIAYRLEPLISPAMSSLKPQSLPYTKKNFFGAPMGQGLTGIPAKMGQSFSGFWSNFQSGLANTFITRSIGLTAEDAARLGAPAPVAVGQQQDQLRRQNQAQQRVQQSIGAGTNIGGGVLSAQHPDSTSTNEGNAAKGKLPSETSAEAIKVEHPPTLIDHEMETLYSGFQKRRRSEQGSDAAVRDFGETPLWGEAEERGRKLKREEAKVRALNSNGRVDYSIQEGAFDISFLASIASHLAYWTDEDVCHFMISQLLAKHRVVQRRRSTKK